MSWPTPSPQAGLLEEASGESAAPPAMAAALRGIRVLDLSRIVAGPLCTLYLADLGADVIKIERKGAGDEMRHYGPGRWAGEGSTFLALNRGKRSLELDLSDPDDLEVARELALHADVLVESFRPGVMERWGLAYDDLREANPGLVYCSITGFGSTGPAAQLGANNLIAEAFGGMLSVSEEPGTPVIRTGPPTTDLFTGVNAALAVLAALSSGGAPRTGCRIATSLLEAQALTMSGYVLGYLGTGQVPSRATGLPFTVPNQQFMASDAPLVVAVNSEDMWRRLCVAIDREDWLERPDLATNAQRMQIQEQLIRELTDVFAQRTRGEWLDALSRARVTSGPVNTVRDLVDHPQVEALGLLRDMPSTTVPDLRTVRLPFSVDGEGVTAHLPPPALGEHTASILQAMGRG